MNKKLRKALILILLCLVFVCGSVLFVGCDKTDKDNKAITVYFFVGSERVSYKIVSLTETPRTPTVECDDGYFVDGWYFDSGEWKQAFSQAALKQYIEDGVGQVSVYAKIAPITYTITYENAKGADLSEFPVTYTIETQTLEIPDIFVEHYTFNGWYMNGEKIEEIALGSFGHVALTASFTPIEYDITYSETKGATNPNPATHNVDDNDIVLEPIAKDGYKFEGWFKGDELVTAIPANSYGEIELKAKWSLVTYNITYVNAKGADLSEFPVTYTIESQTLEIPDIFVEHYTFNGWFMNGEKIEEIALGSFGHVALTASFTPIEYSITYDETKGATNPNPATHNVDDDEIILEPIAKDGYKFEGWFKGDELVTAIPANSVGEIYLTAKWSLVTYTITYKDTLTADISGFPTTFTVESYDIVLPEISGVLCRSFDGWVVNGSYVTVIPTGTTGNIVLTASFTISHSVVKDLGYAPTCTMAGLTDGSHCDRCNEILIEQKEIAALGHNYVPTWTWDGIEGARLQLVCGNEATHSHLLDADVSSVRVDSTCAVNGSITITAKVYFENKEYTDVKTVVLETVPHKYVQKDKNNHTCSMCNGLFEHEEHNYDGYCDVCEMFIEEIKQISTVYELLAVTNDMSSAYVLTSDITISGVWNALGSKDKPFTGKLYGNGYSIIGLNFTATSDYGLFVANNGLIDGLTLVDLSIDATDSSTAAGFAAYNYGTIKNCTVKGSTTINTTVNRSLIAQPSNVTVDCTFVIGAICGENQGKIEDCRIEGTMSSTFFSRCYSYHQGMLPGMNDKATVKSTVYFGNVAGKNNGTISGAVVDCIQTVSVTASAENNVAANYSYAYVNCYAGSLVGQNNSIITGCSARAFSSFTPTATNKNSSCSANVNANKAKMYEDIIGENTDNGRIDSFRHIE